MDIESYEGVKWLTGLTAILAVPFGWLNARQNRTDDAVAAIAKEANKIATSMASMAAHQEHIKESVAELRAAQQQRRKNNSDTEE